MALCYNSGWNFFLIPILMLFCSACNDTKNARVERGAEKSKQAETEYVIFKMPDQIVDDLEEQEGTLCKD